MDEKMVRTQVYLPPAIYNELKQRADRGGLTMAHQIREALAHYIIETQHNEDTAPLLTQDDPLWAMVGMIKSGIPDGSYNHDRYIYELDEGTGVKEE